jgi:putative ABC transport system permease protein
MAEEYRDKEITVLLVDYANPLAAAQFPRYVNTQTEMQAAAPAFEISRLLNVLGVGLDAIKIFGYILIFSSALGLFIALLNSMKERAYDLAVMRSLGGSKQKLVFMVLTEGLLLSAMGGLTGLLFAHLALEGLGIWFAQARQFAISGTVFLPAEFSILGLAIGIGLLASIFPAIVAYRTEISKTLSQ